jgi:CRP-like cAMP-binding protein
VVAGQAAFQAIREGEAIEIGRVGTAELLGVVGVILKEPQNGTVVARDTVLALRFDAARFRQMFQQVPGCAPSARRCARTRT